jgi:hypothetical protein
LKSISEPWLWKVKIRFTENNGTARIGLWILTRDGEMSSATAKAERFLKRSKRAFPNAQILSIEEKGTIDA